MSRLQQFDDVVESQSTVELKSNRSCRVVINNTLIESIGNSKAIPILILDSIAVLNNGMQILLPKLLGAKL